MPHNDMHGSHHNVTRVMSHPYPNSNKALTALNHYGLSCFHLNTPVNARKLGLKSVAFLARIGKHLLLLVVTSVSVCHTAMGVLSNHFHATNTNNATTSLYHNTMGDTSSASTHHPKRTMGLQIWITLARHGNEHQLLGTSVVIILPWECVVSHYHAFNKVPTAVDHNE